MHVEAAEITQVARLSDIPIGTMKRVRAFDQDVLLSNVAGKLYATQDSCGHQRASLAKGTLEGSVVTCPLHHAKFDVTTGKNVGGMQMSMPPELMAKIPQEVMMMFKKTSEIVAEIDIQPLKTYAVEVRDGSVYLQRGK